MRDPREIKTAENKPAPLVDLKLGRDWDTIKVPAHVAKQVNSGTRNERRAKKKALKKIITAHGVKK